VTIETSTDEERLRPVDVPLMCGSAQALRTEAGWRPEIPLERTMGDLLQWWRERLAA
jgi:nucleoside-diphosphate-sugar epimerase